MGAFLDKPKTEKQTEVGAGNDLRYALSHMQGWRTEMEDAHSALTCLPGKFDKWSFFAVFDGHAGSRAAIVAAEKLCQTVLAMPVFNDVDCLQNTTKCDDRVQEGIRIGFLRFDDELRREIGGSMPPPYSSLDLDSGGMAGGRQSPSLSLNLGGEIDHSGSTAICALISPDTIYLGNCGDSRAIFARSGGIVICATEDHKPNNPVEKARIEHAGGTVLIQRVNGSLAVSRSLGDFDYKCVADRTPTEQLVSAEPEVTVIKRQNSSDEILVLACDGIWDVMSNQEVSDFVRSRLLVHDDISIVCNEVLDTCLHKGSRDNMSVIIIAFPNAPKPNLESQALDQKLEESLSRRVLEHCKGRPKPDTNSIFELLQAEVWAGTPPGGGLYSKREFINRVVEKYTKDAQEAAEDINGD